MHSLEDIVDVFARTFPRDLISQDSLRRIKEVARWFPAGISSVFCLELHPEQDRIDFFVCVYAKGLERSILAENLPPRLLQNEYWQLIQGFSRLWNDPAGILYSLPRMWLEFDLHSAIDGIPVPSVFLVIQDPMLPAWKAALAYMLGGSIPRNLSDNLIRCFQATTIENQQYEVGVMYPRGTDSVMLAIDDFRMEMLTELEGQGWSGPAQQVKEIYRQFSPMVDRVTADIDVGDTISQKIGLEFKYPDRTRQKWDKFFSSLVEYRLCSRETATSILSWPAQFYHKFPHHLWQSYASRKIFHVKIVCQPDQPPQAKVYLLFGYRSF